MLDSRLRGNDFALSGNSGASDDDRGECVQGSGFSDCRERLLFLETLAATLTSRVFTRRASPTANVYRSYF